MKTKNEIRSAASRKAWRSRKRMEGFNQMITDEMVEKARNAYLDSTGTQHKAICAALAAVLPDIVEQCAKEADEEDMKDECGSTCRRIARSIRSLATGATLDGKTGEKQ